MFNPFLKIGLGYATESAVTEIGSSTLYAASRPHIETRIQVRAKHQRSFVKPNT